jgi:hypothetical protein
MKRRKAARWLASGGLEDRLSSRPDGAQSDNRIRKAIDMNKLKRSVTLVTALGLAALQAGMAEAGTCTTNNRIFPSQTDTMVMKCRLGNATPTLGTLIANGGGGKSVSATLTSGAAGTNAVAQGVDSSGNLISGCKATSSVAGQTVTDSSGCSGAVLWVASIKFND